MTDRFRPESASVLDRYRQDVKLIPVKSTLEALRMVLEKKADFAVGGNRESYLISQHGFTGISIVFLDLEHKNPLATGIRDDWPELVSILDKSFSAIGYVRIQEIIDSWVEGAATRKTHVKLTSAEQAWIREHPEIRLGVDPARQPMEFVDEKGQLQGISSDYVRILNERLGLNMETVPDLNWPQVMDAVPQRGVDALSGTARTSDRDKYLIYTEPYSYIDWVIVSRSDTPAISDLADLEGRLTSVNEGYASHERMEKQYTGIPLLPGKTTLDVLQNVVDGKAEAAVIELNAGTLIIHAYKMHSLAIDQHVFQKDDPIALAVRNDWPELVQILDKGLASIAPDERERIESKWLAVPIHVGFTKMDILRIVLGVIAVMGIFLVFFMFWNRRLQKEVRERIEAEKNHEKAEEAVRESEADLNRAQATAGLGSYSLDLTTNRVTWSYEMRRLLWCEDVEPSYKLYLSRIHPDDKGRTQAEVQRLLESTESIDMEYRLVGPDATVRWMRDRTRVDRDAQGLAIRLHGTSQDITERKRAEEERRLLDERMQQTQKLQSLGVMAGGIAHDFNNLLHVIEGNVAYAVSKMPPEASSRENLLEIQTASRRATELTDQMLAYSGKQNLVIEKLDLTSLVREMAQLLEVSHSKKAIVKYAFDENLPAIDCDPSQVRQVVMNLITNASEAIGDESGSISIETGVLYGEDEQVSGGGFKEKLLDGRYVYLKVTDTGCGMDEETQRLMFDPFFTTKFTGRGLGLAAVLGIMRAHAGGIGINSEPGKGTTFKIMFPALNESAETTSVEAPIEKDWIGEGTILVVDDEASVRKLTELLLKSKGFNVLTAADGREAIDVFRRHEDEIDLVLLDQTMPVMGGDEALIELRRICKDVRVVLLSGYAEKELNERAKELGYSGFLKKPVDNNHLLDMIHKTLKGIA